MKNAKKIIIYVVGVLLVVAVLAIVDGSKEKDLIGTWAYTYEFEYYEGVNLEVTEYLEFEDGTYRWYMDRETTKEALLKNYDEYFALNEITEEDVIALGFKSIEDCKAQWLEEDLIDLVDDYNEGEGGAGTWQINQGTFLFIENGTSTEYKTDYRLDDNTLYLQTDGITLIKVQ